MKIKDIYYTIKSLGPILNLYVIPDAHFGSPAFLEDEYERLASIIEKDPLAYVIFQGDILDSNRPSTRAIKKVAYHDRKEEYEQEDKRNEFWIENTILPKLKRLIKTTDRCLGMMDGDHFMTMANGLSSTQFICSKLKVPYLGDGQAILKLHFCYSKFSAGGRANTIIHVQHGLGGSGRAGAGVNKLEDTANIWDGIDVFVRGHSHKGFIYPISKYYVPHKLTEIRQRDIWLVNTPSFRTGFVVGQTDYAEKRNYAATAHKFPVLHLSCDKSRQNHMTLRINMTGELL